MRNAVKLAATSFRRGGTLAYEVEVLNQAGRKAKGCHPIAIAVRDAAGRERARYGGQRATSGGRYQRTVALALNELPGDWEIEVRDPLTRTVSRERFVVE